MKPKSDVRQDSVRPIHGSSALSLKDQLDYRQLSRAKEVLRKESDAILELSKCLDDQFLNAVDALLQLKGSLIVTGVGKAGLIGQKIAATMASTGTPAHFLHPTEAVHGDLGRVQANDILLVLSNSGETEEIRRVLPLFQDVASTIIAITANPSSELAKQADIVLLIPL